MYNAACKVDFQPFNRSCSQLTFSTFYKNTPLLFLRRSVNKQCVPKITSFQGGGECYNNVATYSINSTSSGWVIDRPSTRTGRLRTVDVTLHYYYTALNTTSYLLFFEALGYFPWNPHQTICVYGVLVVALIYWYQYLNTSCSSEFFRQGGNAWNLPGIRF